MARQVYFDNMANTPIDQRVIDTMLPHLKNTYGNPMNVHQKGQETAEMIETSRASVAKLIGTQPSEIIFTSCGSESNNFAIKGLAKANEKKGKHIISSSIEHFSVLYALKELEKEGYKVTYVPVDKNGLIDPKAIAAAIAPETTLITVTHASNEIGTIEPIAEIATVAKAKNILIHVDGIQTAGNIPVDINKLGVDSLSLAANMFYGPTGIAALYVKKGVRIVPFIIGGTQEEGRRAGSHNIAGIAGMAKAAELAVAEMDARNKKLASLRDRLLKGISTIQNSAITGHPMNRLPGHASICVRFVEGESMSMFLSMEGISCSTGSACVSKALKASHVLLAIGISEEDVHGSLVFSIGKDSTMEDVDHVIDSLPPIVERLRAMSPMR